MRFLCSFLSMALGSYCWAASSINWEDQSNYDEMLEGHLRELRVMFNDTYPQCINLYTVYPEGKSLDYISEGEPSEQWPYQYFAEISKDCTGIKITARNKMGGRSYVYDPEWFTVHYIFQTPEEGRQIGKNIIRWLTEDDFSTAQEIYLLQALGWRGLYTRSEQQEKAKLDVLSCLGDFLVYDDLRDKLWKTVRGGKIYKGDIGRAICVRSILSNFSEYPKEIQGAILQNVSEYIDSIDEQLLPSLNHQVRVFYSEKDTSTHSTD